MADNFISYERFAALPANIARFGSTVAEVQLQSGRPAKDPEASPMADWRASQGLLALQRNGSDRMRVGQPNGVAANASASEGPTWTLALTRSAESKLRSPLFGQVEGVVRGAPETKARSLMLNSLERVSLLLDYLDETNGMANAVYIRAIAASKG